MDRTGGVSPIEIAIIFSVALIPVALWLLGLYLAVVLAFGNPRSVARWVLVVVALASGPVGGVIAIAVWVYFRGLGAGAVPSRRARNP